MTEFPAMIYKKSRNKGFIANCMMNNIIGFGKTEEEAINNLKECIEKITKIDANIKPMYSIYIAK